VKKEIQRIQAYASQHLGRSELESLEQIALDVGKTRTARYLNKIKNRRFPLQNEDAYNRLRKYFSSSHITTLSANAKRFGLAPSLTVALAKQESAFRPTVVSSAGAIGLMQLIPTTADAMLPKNYQRPLTREKLMEPSTNVYLGTKYLSKLMRRFQRQPERALAAYNAGPTAVSRWNKREHMREIDMFVEEIPYEETQDYVRRVISWKQAHEFLEQTRQHVKRVQYSKMASCSPTP